jgi:thymidylate synthase ThyX
MTATATAAATAATAATATATATYIPTSPPKNLETGLGVGLSPEVLAACLARYSRSNQGIQTILEKFGDKDPESIFKFVDYGHASIAGLTGGIAIAIDEVSMILALKLFEFSQMADGQESSTRYITMGLGPNSILSAQEAGIPSDAQDEYNKCIQAGLKLYKAAAEGLESKVGKDPTLARIPENASPKLAQRLLKNYALDRSRYFLPAAAKTNMALVMSARMWADCLRSLESLPWKEAKELAPLVRKELSKVAPHLVKHSFPDEASTAQAKILCELWLKHAQDYLTQPNQAQRPSIEHNDYPLIQVWQPHNPPWELINEDTAIKNAFAGKYNRYSTVGPWLKRITVSAQWPSMALAEIRDLNRHRTGFRMTHILPLGFYLPAETREILTELNLDKDLTEFFSIYTNLLKMLQCQSTKESFSLPYGLFLGSQLPFEHTQQGDKFVYEVELRTGLGAHFKYAQHLNDAAKEFMKVIPQTQKYIQIGTAEPE